MIWVLWTHDHQRPGGGDLRYQRGDSWAERRAGGPPMQVAARPDAAAGRRSRASRLCSPYAASRRFRATRCDRSSRSTIPSTRSSSALPAPTIPIAPLVRGAIDANPHRPARLLIGDDRVSANPKLNNVVKGWKAARHDWVIIADSNVLMPSDYIQRLLARWGSDTGIVCSPPIGTRPEFFAADIECAFLNTYEARWQYAGDSSGYGFAQGKTMLWRREIIEAGGGIEALGAEIAEDAAATKLVNAQGYERPPRRPAVPAAARPAAPEGRLVPPGSLGAAQARDLPAVLPAGAFDDEPVHASRRPASRRRNSA